MTQSLDARLAIGYLIASQGNQKLAAARASKDLGDETINDAKLLATIADDPHSLNSLARQVRLMATQHILEVYRVTQLAYLEKLPKLSPSDTARAYHNVLQSMISLSESQPIEEPDSGDVKVLLDKLPPRVRQAFQYLLEQPSDSEVEELAPPEPEGVTGALMPKYRADSNGVIVREDAERILAELEAA